MGKFWPNGQLDFYKFFSGLVTFVQLDPKVQLDLWQNSVPTIGPWHSHVGSTLTHMACSHVCFMEPFYGHFDAYLSVKQTPLSVQHALFLSVKWTPHGNSRYAWYIVPPLSLPLSVCFTDERVSLHVNANLF
jgi:hypothetical protein